MMSELFENTWKTFGYELVVVNLGKCGNFRIFQQLKFYVKSILAIFKEFTKLSFGKDKTRGSEFWI